MKKLFSLVMVAIVIVAISACGGKKNTPEAVAEKFLGHLNKKEYAEAKKMGTENTKQMLDMMESFAGMDKKAEAKEVKIENLKCDTQADKSKCTYTAEGKNETIDLVKQDGNWLVDMKKEGAGDQTTPPTQPTDSIPATK
ncbi:MAG: hypothetical protein WCQ95_11605 [Bacteroidota bacterium]